MWFRMNVSNKSIDSYPMARLGSILACSQMGIDSIYVNVNSKISDVYEQF